MQINPDEPAFPIPSVQMPNGEMQWGENGLTIRAQIAAMALQGILASDRFAGPSLQADRFAAAHEAVDAADALIEVLNNQPTTPPK